MQKPVIIREPRLYLVGRPSLALEGLSQFFHDEDVDFTIQGHPVTNPQWERPVDRYGTPSTPRRKPRSRQWDINTDKAGEILAMAAGKICYDAYGRGRSEIEPYLTNILSSGHGSILEHANWNFVIAGVSRVFSHEHVRHRAGCAISQRSQRYVKESAAGQVLMPIIEQNPEALAIWEETVAQAQAGYDKLVELLAADLKETMPDATLRTKTVRSAARGIMPNVTETYLFWTANARALRHYIELRGSYHAEIEIRRLAVQLLQVMQREAPAMFGDFELRPAPDGGLETYTPYTKV